MYNLMIVDDEPHFRARLKGMIPFEALSLTLVGEHDNADAALEMFREKRPDIVMTDMIMPLMNGLDFAKELLSIKPDTIVIVVTGYGSMENIRESMQAGADNYLLKPIKKAEVVAALEKAVSQLAQRREQFLKAQQAELLLSESLPLLQERYLGRLATTGTTDTEENCQSTLDRLSITLSGAYKCISIVIPDYPNQAMDQHAFLHSSIRSIVKELFAGSNVQYALYFDCFERCIVFFAGDEPELSRFAEERFERMHERIRFLLGIGFSVGIGMTVQRYADLGASRRSAEEALNYKGLFGENNIVCYENVLRLEPIPSNRCATMLEDICTNLISRPVEETEACIKEFLRQAVMDSHGSNGYVKCRCIELLTRLNALVEGDQIGQADETAYMEILSATSMLRVQATLIEAFLRSAARHNDLWQSNSYRIVGDAKRYIEEHYADNQINLSEISRHVGLSESYFSSLFKKEAGCSVIEYLNQTRINAAKRLLKTTHMKVYEVALAVGYANSNYFYQMFRKITGQNPKQFSTNG